VLVRRQLTERELPFNGFGSGDYGDFASLVKNTCLAVSRSTSKHRYYNQLLVIRVVVPAHHAAQPSGWTRNRALPEGSSWRKPARTGEFLIRN